MHRTLRTRALSRWKAHLMPDWRYSNACPCTTTHYGAALNCIRVTSFSLIVVVAIFFRWGRSESTGIFRFKPARMFADRKAPAARVRTCTSREKEGKLAQLSPHHPGNGARFLHDSQRL
jgi:hypothetical protein